MNVIETYVTCPFNKSHRILKHRFQVHLVNCRKQYPDHKLICPCDATHMIDVEEYQHHLSVCPSSGNIQCYRNILEVEQNVGTVSLEEACNKQTAVMNEDWSGNNPTYDPLTASENKNVIRAVIGLPRSKKKQYKQYERDRIASLETSGYNNNSNETTTQEKKTDFEKPLRIPKNVAKAVSCNKDHSTSVLASELEKLSMKNDSLTNKNVSTLDNNSSKETSFQKMNLSNSTCDKINNSSILQNISIHTEKQNIYNEESNATAIYENISKTKENILEIKDDKKTNTFVSQKSEPKRQRKEVNIKKENVIKNNLETLGTLNLKPKTAKHLYGEVKKISTGRGFTIAYKNLNSSILKSEDQNKSSEDLGSACGYDDND
ncbi:Gametocyte-specific factor 1 homolog [Anthophora plagiata]